MFSSRLLQTYANLTRLTNTYGVFAVKYDPKRKVYFYHLSQRTIFNCVYYISIFLFWIYRLIEAKRVGSKNDLYLAYLFTLSAIMAIYSWSIFLFKAKEVVSVWNSFLKWAFQFKGTDTL